MSSKLPLDTLGSHERDLEYVEETEEHRELAHAQEQRAHHINLFGAYQKVHELAQGKRGLTTRSGRKTNALAKMRILSQGARGELGDTETG